jgi:phage-related protein
MIKFAVIFLEWANDFLDSLEDKTKQKVIYNIWKSREINDPELFQKLNENIWEFRTKFLTKQIRLLAFWDKTEKSETLVVATHGFIKKTQKTPKSEIEKAERIREQYFKEKEEKKR